MKRELARDDDSDRPRQSQNQLQFFELICREMWRQRSTRDEHEREIIVERDVSTPRDCSALRPELTDARRFRDTRDRRCERGDGPRLFAERERHLVGTDATEPIEDDGRIIRCSKRWRERARSDRRWQRRGCPPREPDVDRICRGRSDGIARARRQLAEGVLEPARVHYA